MCEGGRALPPAYCIDKVSSYAPVRATNLYLRDAGNFSHLVKPANELALTANDDVLPVMDRAGNDLYNIKVAIPLVQDIGRWNERDAIVIV